MFLKAVLTFLVIGVLSVNALTVPIARSPIPGEESQQLEARDLSNLYWGRDLELEARGELTRLVRERGRNAMNALRGRHESELEARGEMTELLKEKARTGVERGRNAVNALRGRREPELEA